MPYPTVLLAEDEPLIAQQITTLLEDSGFRVIPATDPQEILDCCHRDRPDLVLLNFRSAHYGDGMAFARLLKRRFGLPVQFITGARPQDMAASDAFDASLDILYKPFTPGQLRRWLKVWR